MDNRSSTLGRFKLLIKALEGNKNIPAPFAKACRSQGGLAKYSCPSEGIEPMALNTLKSCAEQFIEDGGWSSLDKMRRSYLSALKTAGRATTSAISRTARFRDHSAEQEEALQIERRYRIRLQIAYEALLERMRSMAKNDPEIAQFINRHVTGFSFKRLSMTSTDGVSDDS